MSISLTFDIGSNAGKGNRSTNYLLTGSVTGDDLQYLSDKLSCLTPAQYRHLEDVIDSFLAVVKEK